MALPGWPRLLNIRLASLYTGVSPDSLLNYVAAGELPVIRPARPDTPRARRQRPLNVDSLRLRLFDIRDLDALADRWRQDG